MRLICILLLLLCYNILTAQQVSKGHIVISALYCNSEHLLFSYQNYFNDHIVSLAIEAKGKWRVIASNEPLLIIFSRDWKIFPVYALPGDTIRTKCNSPSGLEFVGNRSFLDLNALAIVENDIGFLIPSLGGIEISKKLNFQYMAAAFDSLFNERIKMLQSLYSKVDKKPPAAFLNIMLYTLYNDYLRPYVREFEGFSTNETPKGYVEKCSSLINLINADSLISDLRYRIFITSYNLFLTRDSLIATGKGQPLYHTAKNVFTSKSKDYLLFQLVKNELIGEPGFVDDFRKICNNKLYIAYIDSLIERNENLNRNPEVLQDTLLKADGSSFSFIEFLKVHHGRPVYIDLWASWCQPCIAEFGPLREFEKRFGEKIDFVSISIDEDRSKWLKAIAKYSLQLKNQLLTRKESPFGKYLDLQGIPRFIMIDRKGRAISLNAPRPSSSAELNRMMENVLKQ